MIKYKSNEAVGKMYVIMPENVWAFYVAVIYVVGFWDQADAHEEIGINMIRIGICDDIAEEREKQYRIVQNVIHRLCLNAEVKCFQSGEDLLIEIEQKGNLDIILLDIEMGGINGIETAGVIRERDYRVIFLFVSFYDTYCKAAIGVQPFAFIDKPVSESGLEPILIKAFQALSEKEEVFEYTYKKVIYKIPISNIRYFESNKREVIIHGTDGTRTFYKKLDEVESRLEQANVKFLRVSKSFLINANYAKEIRYEKVIMDDDREIKISSNYRDRIRKRYIEMQSLC